MVMKKIICLISLLFIWKSGIDSPVHKNVEITKISIINPLSFKVAFQRIHQFEGYYANVKDDKGRETYRGISRRFNPTWIGWSRIDEFKQLNGQIKWNQQIPEVDFWVTDYYLSLWLNEKYDIIKDNDISSYTFEFLIHGTDAKKIIRRTVNKQFPDIYIPFNKVTEYLNYVDKSQYLEDLKKARIQYYHNIVRRDSTQKQFLKHWLSRVNP